MKPVHEADALWTAFVAALHPRMLTPALIGVVADAYAAGRARWSGVSLSCESFAAALGRGVRGEENLEQALLSLHAVELFLTKACSERDSVAARLFDTTYGPIIDAALERERNLDIDDLRQKIMERLLVGTAEEPPKLAGYLGQGELSHWLRVVVARARIDAQRRECARPRPTDASASSVLDGDPELAYLKVHDAQIVREAFVRAVAELEPRLRLVLRYQIAERLGTDEIGRIFGVHPATARRWAASAREQLWSGTKRELTQRLRLRPTEFESLLRAVRSRLDLSVLRLLETSP